MWLKAKYSHVTVCYIFVLLSITLLACGYKNFGKAVIISTKESKSSESPVNFSKAKLDPIARYGGYVLTSRGMPHGQLPAYLWAKNLGTLVAYETFLRRYPDGKNADYFKNEIRNKFVPVEEEWREAWTLYSQMEIIEGAIFDPNEGFILLGRKGNGNLSPFFYEDLITALNCSLTDEKVGVTMNRIFEAGFKQPEEPNKFPYVAYETSIDFYSKKLWNTHLAYILFEGDRMLKSLSHGYDIFLREEVRCKVPGYRSQIEMESAQPIKKGKDSKTGSYGRVWIELTNVKINTTDQKNVAMFSDFAMDVRAESKHKPPLKFAEHIENNYAEYSKELPIFAEVERAARVVSIARWLVKTYPSAVQKLVDDSYEQVKVYVPQVISARYDATHKTSIYERGLIGGVIFPNVNKYAEKPNTKIDDTPLSHIQKTVLASRPNKKNTAWHFSLDDKKRTKYIAWNVSEKK